MKKKHYEAIARLLRESGQPIKIVAQDLADYFEQDNPKFNRDRFLTACGVIEK